MSENFSNFIYDSDRSPLAVIELTDGDESVASIAIKGIFILRSVHKDNSYPKTAKYYKSSVSCKLPFAMQRTVFKPFRPKGNATGRDEYVKTFDGKIKDGIQSRMYGSIANWLGSPVIEGDGDVIDDNTDLEHKVEEITAKMKNLVKYAKALNAKLFTAENLEDGDEFIVEIEQGNSSLVVSKSQQADKICTESGNTSAKRRLNYAHSISPILPTDTKKQKINVSRSNDSIFSDDTLIIISDDSQEATEPAHETRASNNFAGATKNLSGGQAAKNLSGAQATTSTAGSRAAKTSTGTPGAKTLTGARTTKTLTGPRASKTLTGARGSKTLTGARATKNLAEAQAAKTLAATRAAKNLAATRAAKNLPGTGAIKNLPGTGATKNLAGAPAGKNLAGTRPTKTQTGAQAAKNLPGTQAGKNLAGNRPTKTQTGSRAAKNLPGSPAAKNLAGTRATKTGAQAAKTLTGAGANLAPVQTEPVAGPSGLQQQKKHPKRKVATPKPNERGILSATIGCVEHIQSDNHPSALYLLNNEIPRVLDPLEKICDGLRNKCCLVLKISARNIDKFKNICVSEDLPMLRVNSMDVVDELCLQRQVIGMYHFVRSETDGSKTDVKLNFSLTTPRMSAIKQSQLLAKERIVANNPKLRVLETVAEGLIVQPKSGRVHSTHNQAGFTDELPCQIYVAQADITVAFSLRMDLTEPVDVQHPVVEEPEENLAGAANRPTHVTIWSPRSSERYDKDNGDALSVDEDYANQLYDAEGYDAFVEHYDPERNEVELQRAKEMDQLYVTAIDLANRLQQNEEVIQRTARLLQEIDGNGINRSPGTVQRNEIIEIIDDPEPGEVIEILDDTPVEIVEIIEIEDDEVVIVNDSIIVIDDEPIDQNVQGEHGNVRQENGNVRQANGNVRQENGNVQQDRGDAANVFQPLEDSEPIGSDIWPLYFHCIP